MTNQNNDKLIILCGPSGTTNNNYNTKWVIVKIIIVIRITHNLWSADWPAGLILLL